MNRWTSCTDTQIGDALGEAVRALDPDPAVRAAAETALWCFVGSTGTTELEFLLLLQDLSVESNRRVYQRMEREQAASIDVDPEADTRVEALIRGIERVRKVRPL